MPDYASNSHKAREGNENPEGKPVEKKVEKIITGEVINKKPPIGTRIKHIFFGGDAKNVGEYLAQDVLVPTVRNLIVDAFQKGVERMVYGETSYRAPRRTSIGYPTRVQYDNPMRRDPRPSLPDRGNRQVRRESNDIVLAQKQDAEHVLDKLITIIDQYEVASLADLYELIGQSAAHTDNKWGWTDLKTATIKQVRDGYLLDLPPTEEI